MASQNPSLHSFVSDLQNKVAGNTPAPPRSIRAKDLDGNFKTLTIIPNTNIPYTVNYSADGTSLDIFPAVPDGGNYVLGATNGTLRWISQESITSPVGGF
jgi:hypothetical protein